MRGLTARRRAGVNCNWTIVGDPTAGALVVAAMKAGLRIDDREKDVTHELPFDSERKAMSVVVRSGDDSYSMYTKGAPEVILGKCVTERQGDWIHQLTEEGRARVLYVAQEMAKRALRVLALACREAEGSRDTREERFTFVGLVGMMDPPRDEAAVVQREFELVSWELVND